MIKKYRVLECSTEVTAKKLEQSDFDFASEIRKATEFCDPVGNIVDFVSLDEAKKYYENCDCSLCEYSNHSIRYYLISYYELEEVTYNDNDDEIAWECMGVKYPDKPSDD